MNTKIRNIFTLALEKLGLRCSMCGSWGKTMLTSTFSQEWRLSQGGIGFMNPFIVERNARFCTKCGHIMSGKNKPSHPILRK